MAGAASTAGEKHGSEKIVGEPQGGPGQQVRRGGGEEHQIGLFGQLDVRERLAAGPERGVDGSPAERLERHGAHEFRGAPCHHDIDLEPRVTQPADEDAALVAGDSARDAENHSTPGEAH